VWSPRLLAPGAERRLRTRTIPPALAPLAAGLLLAATPLRRLGAALCALGVAGNLDVARPRTVPGANDNASGVAVVLDLVRAVAAEPLAGTEVLVVLPGGEEAGMDGFAAWLRARRSALDPARTLVLGLDTLGCGTPVVLRAEGALRTHRYDPALLDRADAAARAAGEPTPPRWRIPGWTDPLLARREGLPAVSLLSIGPQGHFTHYHVPSDVPAHVDHESVAACARLARALVARAGPVLGR
jgi:Zn-dependent M28 family amino/carboxypeptidase